MKYGNYFAEKDNKEFLVHVYGQKMMGDVLVLDVVGYSGNAHLTVPRQ